jgi:hypothetical protein
VDGDFIRTAEEVQPVLRALRQGGIHVVALPIAARTATGRIAKKGRVVKPLA